jgi:hypothetical protein
MSEEWFRNLNQKSIGAREVKMPEKTHPEKLTLKNGRPTPKQNA